MVIKNLHLPPWETLPGWDREIAIADLRDWGAVGEGTFFKRCLMLRGDDKVAPFLLQASGNVTGMWIPALPKPKHGDIQQSGQGNKGILLLLISGFLWCSVKIRKCKNWGLCPQSFRESAPASVCQFCRANTASYSKRKSSPLQMQEKKSASLFQQSPPSLCNGRQRFASQCYRHKGPTFSRKWIHHKLKSLDFHRSCFTYAQTHMCL